MGGVAGSVFGGWGWPGDTGDWALIGISAMMAGTMRAKQQPVTILCATLNRELNHAAVLQDVIGED